MQLDKALRREHKQHKARHGMRITGRSVFTIQAEQVKRAGKPKKKGKR